MKVVQINVASYGSTGRIMYQVQKKVLDEGNEAVSFFGRGNVPEGNGQFVKIAGKLSVVLHGVKARLFDKMGHGSLSDTKKLVKLLKEEAPDIVHLHNLHGYFINLKVLFKYLKESGVQVVWTMHDCWPITGGCAYFLECGCDKWKKGCNKCSQIDVYPKRYVDKSKREYSFKKKIFTDLDKLTITTPSNWLAGLVKQSFMKNYPVKVVYNGIDVDIFKPYGHEINRKTREWLGIPENGKMILGVANVWDERKRLSALLKLAVDLKDSHASVVIVGLSEKQKAALPAGIIGITRTQNQEQLARIYSAADVFVSTSVEESFSLVVGEAMASGTPIVCVDGGGCSELVSDNVGVVVPRDDREALKEAVVKILNDDRDYLNDCRQRCVENYSCKSMVDGYMNVYREIYGS